VRLLRNLAGAVAGAAWLRLAVPLAVLWEMVPRAGVVPRTLIPTPSDVAVAALGLARGGELLRHLASSLGTLALGLILAVTAAVPLAVIVGWNPWIRRHLLPFIQATAPIPPTAWVPLAIVLVGIGLPMKVFLVFLGAFFPIFLNTYQAIRDTSPRYLVAARAFGASELTLILHVYVWQALGAVVMSVRTGVALGLVMLTAAEMYGGRAGVGFLLVEAKEFFRVPEMVVCMAVLGAVGWCLSQLLMLLQTRLSRWREAEART
jgi:ABC-type nitrate/sulfonate/bicarbonate transport system permease component